jgi:DNA-directed RNA polymerase subunit RPC12/RpoP
MRCYYCGRLAHKLDYKCSKCGRILYKTNGRLINEGCPKEEK